MEASKKNIRKHQEKGREKEQEQKHENYFSFVESIIGFFGSKELNPNNFDVLEVCCTVIAFCTSEVISEKTGSLKKYLQLTKKDCAVLEIVLLDIEAKFESFINIRVLKDGYYPSFLKKLEQLKENIRKNRQK